MARRPTILDVAKAAGVSKSTVSLVLQGSDSVRKTTRDEIRKAMSDLGYVYNRSAASMRSASSGLIGLVINDMRNPFFTEFAASLQEVLADQGYATVIANTNEDAETQTRMIASLIEHGISGLIVSPAYGAPGAALTALQATGTPTIQVLRKMEGCSDDIPFIAPDYERGSRLATQHLLTRGCKRIAFLGGLSGRPVTKERMSGYLSVLDTHGLEPLVLSGEATRAFGKDMAHKLRSDHPDLDGVLCFNDLVALGVLSASAEHGPQIGPELKVIGFDDIEACVDSFPALSSVSCNIPELAQLAADGLLTWIKSGQAPQMLQRTQVSLICRASSCD